MHARPAKAKAEATAKAKAPLLRVAGAVLLAQAAGMLVAAGYAATATATGKSYQVASGIALTLIAFATAVGVAVVAKAIVKARLWSRTPALLIQLFAGGTGVFLLEGHRYDWGIPTLLLTAAGFIALFAPSSFNALKRET
jgi:hypothetical protein